MVVIAVAALALSACTSSKSGSPSSSGSSVAPPPTSVGVSASPAAPGSTGAVVSGPSAPGAGSSKPGGDTYTPPESAPYPTTGRGAEPVSDQTKVLGSLPGIAKSTCAQVGTHADLRSGGIGMGNFETARRDFAEQFGKTEVPQLNMYIIPQHTKHLTSATVRVDPPGSGQPSTIVVKDVEQADIYRYFPLTLPVRSPGSYRLSVTSGADRGCFIVTFSK
jgi:hypothetical protein